LLAVIRRHTRTLGIDAPPALKAPEALIPHPEARNPAAATPRLARFEIEEPLEDRRGAGPIGFALA
jgi:hypothetical protein